MQRLDDGDPVVRRFTLRHEGVEHIGALGAIWLRQDPEEALEAISDMRSVCRWLPYNQRADVIGESGGAELVRLTLGRGMLSTELTVRLTRDASALRFELDEDHPYDFDALQAVMVAGPFELYGTIFLFELTFALPGPFAGLVRDELWQSFPQIMDDMRSYIQTATIVGYAQRQPCSP